MRRVVFILISIVVSGIFMALAINDVPLEGIGEQLANADWLWIVVTLAMITLGLWARAVRWQGLLGYRMSFVKTFHVSNIMFFLNFLPFRLGEAARTVLAARYGVPFMTAATSVIVERLIDTVFVVVVLSLALAQIPNAPPGAAQSALLFGIAAVVGFIVLIVLARFPAFAERMIDLAERLLPFLKRLPLRKFLGDVLAGLVPLTQWRSGGHAILWTLIAWVFSFGGYVATQQALRVTGVDLLQNAFLTISLTAFGIAIPLVVAGVGVYQGAARVSGETLGLAGTLAFSLGVLYHVLTFIGYCFWGIVGLLALGVSLSDVTRGQPAQPQAQPHA
jgi:glycosyltransferase 2 family protein